MTGTLAMYLQAMQGWPAAVAEAAAPILERHAKEAYAEIKAGYPVVTGHLRDGLTITNETSGPLHPAWTLENDVVYAKIFEAGGATTAGPKPAGRVFVPIVIKTRRALRRDLIPVLQRVVDGQT
jgi:hypothetical protein